jgi:hypothetical protein
MLEEGGCEANSYWEYGFPSPLATGIEHILTSGLQELRAHGIE